jgi:TolB protein
MLTEEPSGALDPACSPDGSPIAYRKLGDGRIISMAADGSGATPLTDGPGDAEPEWSPDGKRIVFSSEHDGDREIHVMAADGSDVTQLTDPPDFDGQPTWSLDGTMIAFATNRVASRDVYLMKADGSTTQSSSRHRRSVPTSNRSEKRSLLELSSFVGRSLDGCC